MTVLIAMSLTLCRICALLATGAAGALEDLEVARSFSGYNHMPPAVRAAIKSGEFFEGIAAWTFRACPSGAEVCPLGSVDLGGVRSEAQLMHALVDICDELIAGDLDKSKYRATFGNIIDCARDKFRAIVTSIWGLRQGSQAVLRDFHPIVPLSPRPGCSRNWMWDLPDHQSSVYSQNGQDGVLQEILRRIGTTNHYFVEIGYNQPEWAPGSNTYLLHTQGWTGLLLDGQFQNTDINLHRHFITPSNICDILRQHRVPLEPDYVSIDIDSLDVWVGERLLETFRPRIVSIEYNAHFPISSTLAMNPRAALEGTVMPVRHLGSGASAGAVRLMLHRAGYEVVMLTGLLDVIAVRKDILNDKCPLPFASFSNQVNILHSCVPPEAPTAQQDEQYVDRLGGSLWVDYRAWVESGGDVEHSSREAITQLLGMTFPSTGAMGSPQCLGLF